MTSNDDICATCDKANQLEIVRTLSGRKKYQYLISAENNAELVKSLPAQELFLLIKEVGLLDVSDLIGLATPEQITLCVDMDCWVKDELDSDESLQWLHLLLIQDEEAFLRLIDGLDFELLVMMVKRQLTIISGLESLHDDEDLMATRKRFDQVYDCEYRNEDVAKIMSAFQDVLFRERQEHFLRIMEAVRHEFDLGLQEDAFMARKGRLEDLGFVDSYEASSLFSYLAPESFNPEHHSNSEFVYGESEQNREVPSFMLTITQPQDLLGELLSGSVSTQLSHELSFLLNRALSAESVDFGEPDQVRQCMEGVYHTLNIALGYLCGNDLTQADSILNGVYLHRLYQLGFSLTVDQRRRAEKIQRAPIGAYLDGPDAALIRALCQRKPQFYRGLLDPTRADSRCFESWSEIQKVQRELEYIELLQTLFSDTGLFILPAQDELELDGCSPQLGSEVTLSELFLTALANQIMGREFLPVPIASEELYSLQQKISADSDIFAGLRQQTCQWVESHCAGVESFVNFCLDVWQYEFNCLEVDELNAQHVGGLLIRL